MRVASLSVLAALLFCGGCEAVIVPPVVAHDVPTTPVFVADYGYHSSLILPRGDGMMMEYAYGDWNYFANNHKTFGSTLDALFSSEQATLGRRVLLRSPYQAGLGEAIGAKSVVRFDASRDKVAALDMELSNRFSRDLDSLIYTPAQNSYFVKDAEHYSIGNNCNHLTARWLERLGCRVEGRVFGSRFRVKEAESVKAPNSKSQIPSKSEITMIE
jgi:hypothetical protein